MPLLAADRSLHGINSILAGAVAVVDSEVSSPCDKDDLLVLVAQLAHCPAAPPQSAFATQPASPTSWPLPPPTHTHLTLQRLADCLRANRSHSISASGLEVVTTYADKYKVPRESILLLGVAQVLRSYYVGQQRRGPDGRAKGAKHFARMESCSVCRCIDYDLALGLDGTQGVERCCCGHNYSSHAPWQWQPSSMADPSQSQTPASAPAASGATATQTHNRVQATQQIVSPVNQAHAAAKESEPTKRRTLDDTTGFAQTADDSILFETTDEDDSHVPSDDEYDSSSSPREPLAFPQPDTNTEALQLLSILPATCSPGVATLLRRFAYWTPWTYSALLHPSSSGQPKLNLLQVRECGECNCGDFYLDAAWARRAARHLTKEGLGRISMESLRGTRSQTLIGAGLAYAAASTSANPNAPLGSILGSYHSNSSSSSIATVVPPETLRYDGLVSSSRHPTSYSTTMAGGSDWASSSLAERRSLRSASAMSSSLTRSPSIEPLNLQGGGNDTASTSSSANTSLSPRASTQATPPTLHTPTFGTIPERDAPTNPQPPARPSSRASYRSLYQLARVSSRASLRSDAGSSSSSSMSRRIMLPDDPAARCACGHVSAAHRVPAGGCGVFDLSWVLVEWAYGALATLGQGNAAGGELKWPLCEEGAREERVWRMGKKVRGVVEEGDGTAR